MNISIKTVTVVSVIYSDGAVPAYVDQTKTLIFQENQSAEEMRLVTQKAFELAQNFAQATGCNLSVEEIWTSLRNDHGVIFDEGNVSVHWS